MMKTTIVIVDDHPIIASCLSKLINQEDDLEVVGCVDTLSSQVRCNSQDPWLYGPILRDHPRDS